MPSLCISLDGGKCLVNRIYPFLSIWLWMQMPPYVNPPPNPISNRRSFFCILFSVMPVCQASGMEAADGYVSIAESIVSYGADQLVSQADYFISCIIHGAKTVLFT